MAEGVVYVYQVNTSNQPSGTGTPVAVVNDGTGDRQIVVLGAGDNSGAIFDGSPANPQNINDVTTTSALLTKLQLLIDVLTEAQATQVAVPFARDASDQLLANIASGTLTNLGDIEWGNSNAEAVYYSTGAPNSMDMREHQEVLSEINFNDVRHGRWVFS